MRRAVVGAMLAVFLLFAVFEARPWLTDARDFPASIPSPAAVTSVSVIRVPAGGRLCADSLAMEQHSQQLRFKLDTKGRPGPALRIGLNGEGGYRASGALAGGYPDGTLAQVAVSPPPGTRIVVVCVRNLGGRSVGLFASADRTQSRSVTTVNGLAPKPSGSVWMAFYERSPHSIASRATTIVHRMSAFRPGFVGPALWWPLFLVLLLGAPALLAAAVARALGDDESEPDGGGERDAVSPALRHP